VTYASSDNVMKLKASDGSLVGTYAVGDVPFGICFDGANIWVTNLLDNTVTKL
jgi:DNA-binding beta-propeller fold protein YncE